MTPAEQKLFNRGTMLIAAAGMEPDLEATAYGVDQIAEPVDAATHAILDFEIAISIGQRPALSFEAYRVTPGVLATSWNQGEY